MPKQSNFAAKSANRRGTAIDQNMKMTQAYEGDSKYLRY